MTEITDSVFGKMSYNHRWIKEENFLFLNKDFKVKVCAKAFNEKPITDEQRKSYSTLKSDYESIVKDCTPIAIDYLNKFYSANIQNETDLINNITFTHIIFMQDGDTILLFDTDYDVENGIGIQIYPTMEIGPQDTFL